VSVRNDSQIKEGLGDMTTTVTTIDLLRHGACEGGEIFRGSSDVALSAHGWQQMRAAIAQDAAPWQSVVSSSLQRCARFAEEVAAQRQLPLQLEARLQEIHFGDWEMRTHKDVQREAPGMVQRFFEDPFNVTPPNGELMTDFRDRVMAAAQELLQQHAGRHILLVTHGAVIRVLLCEWLHLSYAAFSNIAVPYASFSRLRLFQMPERSPWMQLCLHRGDQTV
jgi:alpha-ribazole phosphatase